MADRLVLDTWPLSQACHPKPDPQFQAWLTDQLARNAALFVPEVADYELRRELIRAGKQESIERLNALERTLGYLAIDTATMHRAAEL